MTRLVIALLVCAVFPLTTASERVTLDAAARARAGIVVRPVLERSFGARLSVVGEVVRAPGTTISVRTSYDARIEELLVAPGERVRRGAPLLRVHSHEIQHGAAEYLRYVEELRMAESRVQAGEELLALEGISRLELERRRQEAYNARLRVEAERHHLQDMGLTPSDLETMVEHGSPEGVATLAAPSDGVVLSLNAQQHQWYQAFDPLVEVGDPDRVELQIQVAPADAGRVETGQTVEFAPVGYPERAGRAQVISAIPVVDPVTRTVTVRARIGGDPGSHLVPLDRGRYLRRVGRFIRGLGFLAGR